MRTNRLRAAASASVLLVALAACNNDATPAADETDPAATATGQPAEPSESPAEQPSEEPGGESGGYDAQQLLAAMKAAVADKESAHMTMTIRQDGQSLEAEGDVSYAGKDTAMRLVMNAPQLGGNMEIRLVDGFVYMSVPPLTPAGKFMKLDTNDPASPFGDLSGVTESDPLATFDAFDAGLQEVTYLGEEDLDGETVHHYVLTVDSKKAAKAQGQPAPSGAPTITYDLWIDENDLMRQIEFAENGGGLTMRMDDWGKKVTVKAPPASAIVDAPTIPGAPS